MIGRGTGGFTSVGCGVPVSVPPAIADYTAHIAAAIVAVIGRDLEAVYLHGSAVLGGFGVDRSDVDALAVVRRPLGRERLGELAAAVSHARIPNPACGLELDVITLDVARRPRHPSPFELNLSTGPDGDVAVFGESHGPSTDVILHLAVVRTAGVALVGPPATEVVGAIPREWLLAEFRHELDWGLEHGSTAYQTLNAARVWRFAEEGVICSKVDGGRWALGRGYDSVLEAAIEFQEGRSDVLPDAEPAARLVARAQDATAQAPTK